MQDDTISLLNVTELEPRMKHPTIFNWFDQLEEGGAFVILNDHDPKPLYYQFLGERGNTFTWEYLQNGPEWWRVKIGKRRAGESDPSMKDIAESDLKKAAVFKKYGLDFSCSGGKTLKEVCLEKGIDVAAVEHEMQMVDKATASNDSPEMFRNLKPGQIITLDVRPTLAGGVDPLQIILHQVKQMQPGQVLKLVNTFEPVPLLKVLGRQGFDSFVEHLEQDLVITWFYKSSEDSISETESVIASTELDWDQAMKRFEGKLQMLDVRHLEMPMPMHAILDALNALTAESALFVFHKKMPVFLLPELTDLGFQFRSRELGPGEVHLLIFK